MIVWLESLLDGCVKAWTDGRDDHGGRFWKQVGAVELLH